jgi:hypothetical protein
MSFDLKPLTNETIHKMGYTPHDLWVVKFDNNEEVFGPFEVESLKDYATENEKQFQKAFATRMDTNDWQPFFTHAHFQKIEHPNTDAPAVEKYWILNLGQKAGPLSRRDIDKKMELDLLSMTDVVSIDDGHTWIKFFNLAAFNTQTGGVDALPMAPLESSFQRAKEELHDYMDGLERTGSHAGLAALTYLGQHKDKKMTLNLEEMDLRSLAETEVSRSLKWAIPTAVAGIGVFVLVGGFVLSPSTWTETASTESEKSETIMPKAVSNNDQSQHQPNRRRPASYQPMQHQRSGLTHTPAMNQNEYPTHVETHYNEPDMNQDMDNNIQPDPQENSLVSNQVPMDNNGETLDQVMGSEEAPIPEQPVIEEASDF